MPPFDSPWYRAALSFARDAHAGQVDRAGKPYIEHAERVARILVRRWPDATKAQVQAALLHDSIEDCGLTAADLLAAGFEPEAVGIIAQMTHEKTEPYANYIDRIAQSGNIGAIRCKLADNEDNSSPARAHPDREAMMAHKYLPARAALETALAALTPA